MALSCVCRLGFYSLLVVKSAIAIAQTPETPQEGRQTDTPKADVSEADIVYQGDDETENNTEATEPTDNDDTQKKVDVGQTQKPPLAKPTLLKYTLSQQESLIAQQLDKEHVVWLGKEEEKFLGVWHVQYDSQPKGAVLILPDQNMTAAERSIINNLQYYLSKNGWSTLAIELPPPLEKAPPPRPALPKAFAPEEPSTMEGSMGENGNEVSSNNIEGDDKPGSINEPNTKNLDDTNSDPDIAKAGENSDEKNKENRQGSVSDEPTGENKETENANATEKTESPSELPSTTADNQQPLVSQPPEPIEPKAHMRMQTGLNYLQSQNQFNNVIIAQGSSAARVMLFIQALQRGDITVDQPPAGVRMRFPLRAIILSNTQHSLYEDPDFTITDSIKDLTIPVLDIRYSSHLLTASKRQEQLALQRKKAGKMSQAPAYIERVIQPPTVGQRGETRYTRIIRGFLHRNAEGVEDEKQ